MRRSCSFVDTVPQRTGREGRARRALTSILSSSSSLITISAFLFFSDFEPASPSISSIWWSFRMITSSVEFDIKSPWEAKTIQNKAESTCVHLTETCRSSHKYITYLDTPVQISLMNRIRVIVVVFVAIIILVFGRRRRSVGSQGLTMVAMVAMTRRRTRMLQFRTRAQTQAQGGVRV
jgi:hypothetical protein